MSDIPNVLEKIAAYKRGEVASLKNRATLRTLYAQAEKQSVPKPFAATIRETAKTGPALITEVKKASPSKGIIREDFDPVSIARGYTNGGAACLSVLTDTPSFMGSNDIFRDVRAVSDLPLLRKDFMLEPIQIAESRAMGADAILVIMAMLDDAAAAALMQEAKALGMDALVETHDETELSRAVDLGATLIGINNRDLRTFETSLDTFVNLAPKTPKGCTLIAESGIFKVDDIEALTSAGAAGFLVGESLMRQDNVEIATRTLRGIS